MSRSWYWCQNSGSVLITFTAMRWLLILAIALPLATEPAEPPKDKGATEANRPQSTAQTKNTENKQTPSAQPTPAAAQAPIATESQRSAATANDHTQTSNQQASDEDRSTQWKLTLFTGVLAGVGVLQLVVMSLTWLVYRRQAYEMRRQRHEMKRQREYMRLQWETMGEQVRLINEQLKEMQGAGKQTDKLIEQATRQAEQLTTVASAGKISAEAAAKAAVAAEKSANSYQAAERAWMAQTDVVYSSFFDSTFGNSAERINGVMFQIKWANAGDTPAINCSVLMMQEKTVNDIIPTFRPAPNIGEAHGPILPRVSVSAHPAPFPNNDIEALKKRECRIFLYSRADYKTVYAADVPHHTEVCMEVLYAGMETDSKTNTQRMRFIFRVAGPQNSAN